jgi:hypothetical protein
LAYFEQKFDFFTFNKQLTENIVRNNYIIALDPSYILKSGKLTYRSRNFFSVSAKTAK